MTLHPFPPPVAAAEPIATVTPMVAPVPAFDTHALEWAEKGWEVLPMSPGAKVLLAKGVTGYSGKPFTLEEIRAAISGTVTYQRPDHPDGPELTLEWTPNRNLGLRMPPGVVGIDVDGYGGKTGGMTIRELEEKAGCAFPPTFVLTARHDQVSGIRLYRVPPGTKLADQRDVEMIQNHHRYALAAGSMHHTGQIYRTLRLDTWEESAVIPHRDDCPMLPAALIKVLKAKDVSREFGGVVELPDEQVQAWIGEHLFGSGWSQTDAQRAYDAAWGEAGSRNTAVFKALVTGLREARDGRCSATDAIAWISAAHAAACAADGSHRSGRNEEEVTRAVGRIVSKFLGEQVELVPAAAPRRIQAVDLPTAPMATRWLMDTLGTGRLSGVFIRDGRLVHCVRYGEEGFQEISNGHDDFQQVSPMTENSLLGLLSVEYDFARVDARSQTPKLIHFPRESATMAINAPYGAPNLKTLRGATSVPVVRADGTILDAAGYDEATGLLYEPDAGMEAVKVAEAPTAEDVTNAVAWIEEVVGQMPFSTESDKSNYLTFLITPLLRIALPGPRKLVILDARQPGTGKTLLAEVAHMIHGGVMRPSFPDNEPEVSKELTTLLLNTSSPVITFDNVEGTLKSAALTSLLTSTTYTGRILGGNTQIDQLNDRMWSITGNNVQIGGDLARRSLWVDIDAGIPDPQNRTGFKHNLKRWVPQHRPQIIWALLTLIRAWQVAGSPMGPEKGSDGYAEWIRVCDGVLKHAGYPGEVGGGVHATTLSRDDLQWLTFLEALYETFGPDYSFTAKEVIQASLLGNASGHSLDEMALPTPILEKRMQAASASVSLGQWFRRKNGRWAGSCRIVEDRPNRNNTMTWKVERHQT